MCSSSPPKPKRPAPEIKSPELKLGVDNPSTDIRLRQRRGRNQLRTDIGLAIPLPTAGLNVPSE